MTETRRRTLTPLTGELRAAEPPTVTRPGRLATLRRSRAQRPLPTTTRGALAQGLKRLAVALWAAADRRAAARQVPAPGPRPGDRVLHRRSHRHWEPRSEAPTEPAPAVPTHAEPSASGGSTTHSRISSSACSSSWPAAVIEAFAPVLAVVGPGELPAGIPGVPSAHGIPRVSDLLFVGGLIVGALARLALPGPDPMSIPMTAVLGIGGSIIGGLVSRLFLGYAGGFVFAFLGALLLLYLQRRYIRHRVVRRPTSVSPPLHATSRSVPFAGRAGHPSIANASSPSASSRTSSPPVRATPSRRSRHSTPTAPTNSTRATHGSWLARSPRSARRSTSRTSRRSSTSRGGAPTPRRPRG